MNNIINYIDAFNILKTPSYSGYESNMINTIIEWCKTNKIKYHKDEFNNLYLTKGTVNNDEYYPCITAHLDTVHERNISLIKENKSLKLLINKSKNKTKISSPNFGIGGDDKCGIIIALTLISKCRKLKVALFSSEEKNMNGSKNLNISFFKNVGYVISFDAPGNNGGAYACNGLKLFSYDFYFNKIKRICDKYRYFYFENSPSTDVENIRKEFNIECIVLSAGYYKYHTKNEYIILEDVNKAALLGLSIIKAIKFKKYPFLSEEYIEYKSLKELLGMYISYKN